MLVGDDIKKGKFPRIRWRRQLEQMLMCSLYRHVGNGCCRHHHPFSRGQSCRYWRYFRYVQVSDPLRTTFDELEISCITDPYVTVSLAKFGKPLFSTRIATKEKQPVWEATTAVLIRPEAFRVKERIALRKYPISLVVDYRLIKFPFSRNLG